MAGTMILKSERDPEQKFKKVIVGLDEKGQAYSREPSTEDLEKMKKHQTF